MSSLWMPRRHKLGVTDICIEELGLPKNVDDSSWEANKEQIKSRQKQSKVRDSGLLRGAAGDCRNNIGSPCN